MIFKITYLENGFIQYKELVNCLSDKDKYKVFTFNSPFYKCIEDGSFEIILKYSKHKIKVEEI